MSAEAGWRKKKPSLTIGSSVEEAFGRRKACFASLNKERMCKTCIFGRDTVSLRKKKNMGRSCGRSSSLLLLLRRGKREKREGPQETVKTKMIVQSANKTKRGRTREWKLHSYDYAIPFGRTNLHTISPRNKEGKGHRDAHWNYFRKAEARGEMVGLGVSKYLSLPDIIWGRGWFVPSHLSPSSSFFFLLGWQVYIGILFCINLEYFGLEKYLLSLLQFAGSDQVWE